MTAIRSMIVLEDVEKEFRTNEGPLLALDGVSLNIEEHEFVSVVGPSGCGKSTLMLLMGGLIPLTGGHIWIQGRDVREPYTDLGIVFQSDVLLEWRTAIENVLLQYEIRGGVDDSGSERARALLLQVGLEGFANRYPRELSGGMRQRVAICRALVHDPPVLFMDEPFGALDALTREQMIVDLLRLSQENQKTVVFITHSISEAVILSDRVIVMSPRPGTIQEVVQVDLPRPREPDVKNSSAFVEIVNHIEDLFKEAGVLH